MKRAATVCRWVVHNPPSMTLLACGVLAAGVKLEPYGALPLGALVAALIILAMLVTTWKDMRERR